MISYITKEDEVELDANIEVLCGLTENTQLNNEDF